MDLGCGEIFKKTNLSISDLEYLLKLENEEELSKLSNQARKTTEAHLGNKVYFRGLLEFSNMCENDCLYCGIMKSNKNVKRYLMPKEEIVSSALWAFQNNYGSILLQSGQLTSQKMVEFIEDVVAQIKSKTIEMDPKRKGLGITLCVGEQIRETYKRFFDAGAHRYLLRIETSNPELFSKIHPPEYSFEKRYGCLKILKELGYQVGTGVMIGLPGQSTSNLANDILFFKENDIDMIGMGPYIIHQETPLAKRAADWESKKEHLMSLALKMIATTRVALKDVNIAATTALQALDPVGREKGISFGANIVMPIITPAPYRKEYFLYDNKPCLGENREMCTDCLKNRVMFSGREVGLGEWGDSRHYFERCNHGSGK